jgi:GT2 family glycosyltransferase
LIPISLITVNYNHSDLTIDLIRSLEGLDDKRFELIVVDNGSQHPFEYESEVSFDLSIIHSKVNLGFAGGNELGMKKAKGAYFFLINNDTEVRQSFVEPIVQCFSSHPNLGMLSVLLRFYDTQLIQFAGATSLSKLTLRNRSYGYGEKDATRFKGYRQVGNVHGAALIVPQKLYKKLGGMWQPFFLYYEEYDWCAKFKEAGYEIGFLGDVEILHKESASVGQLSPLKVEYMFRNRILFTRRRSTVFKYITVFYLMTFVLARDTINYLLQGRFSLLYPLYKGAFRGVSNSIV